MDSYFKKLVDSGKNRYADYAPLVLCLVQETCARDGGGGTPGHGSYPVFYDRVVPRDGHHYSRMHNLELLEGYVIRYRGATLVARSVSIVLAGCSLTTCGEAQQCDVYIA